jgi:hypothetical protein
VERVLADASVPKTVEDRGPLERNLSAPRVGGGGPMRSNADDPEGRHGQRQARQRRNEADLDGPWGRGWATPGRDRRKRVFNLMHRQSLHTVVIGQWRH